MYTVYAYMQIQDIYYMCIQSIIEMTKPEYKHHYQNKCANTHYSSTRQSTNKYKTTYEIAAASFINLQTEYF